MTHFKILDAAKLMNVSSKYVRKLIKTWQLRAFLVGKGYLITKNDLDNFIKSRLVKL